MGTMGCNEFFERFEQWMEGERPSDLQAHVQSCAECRGLVRDLETIQHAAPALASADPEPSARVWLSLRTQLEQEGLIHGEHPGWAEKLRGWLGGVFGAVPRPALAGAYLVALVAVGIALTGPSLRQTNDDRWINGTQVSTQPLSAQLNTAEQDSVSSMVNSDPVVTASLQKNLAIVDNYIALCEKSVHEEPESEMARDYLYEAYQQKADLLAQMTERGDDGR
jgi:hypothetical protein